MPNLYLFDSDGVIFDSLPVITEVFNILSGKYHLGRRFSEEEFALLFTQNIHYRFKEFGLEGRKAESFLKDKSEMYLDRINEFRIFPGMKDVMGKLSGKGVVVIISSNNQALLEELAKKHGLSFVKEILGSEVERSKVKKILMMKEKYAHEKAYYIGDTTGDIAEARKGGVVPVAVTWGFHNRALLEGANPDFIFDRPEELLNL
ncbi:HAD family hydrolase [Candidatus Woesearchaeota archaeon]|nr:MAG: HAD family hydrolase [Candidatus Woesearchaeota archaeon]